MPDHLHNVTIRDVSHVDNAQLCDFDGCSNPGLYEISAEGEQGGTPVEGTFACCHDCADWGRWYPVKNGHVEPHPDDPRNLEVAADA